MPLFSTIRAAAQFLEWWCRIYPLRQIHNARKELLKLEDEKALLDENPSPTNFAKSKRLLYSIQEAKKYLEYLSNTYAKTSSRNNNSDA